MSEIISARRNDVIQSYKSAEATNRRLFLEGDDKATEEYIFPNQIKDAEEIIKEFYTNNRRVISIQKKTKVGADGLMIEIAKLITTHDDDNFVVNPSNVRIITGMSNVGWEKDMIDKAPSCFKDKIYHHGKLSKADLRNINNGLIIIDEIDTGDKEFQVLHNTLKEVGVLDINYMETNNIRFVFISATMIKELHDLYRWGDFHKLHKMTIPESYFGHKDFLEKDIIKDFFPLNNEENVEKWIQEDILNNYENDYRVHLVRVNPKTVNIIQNECIRKRLSFRNHTSKDRLSDDEIKEFFKDPLTGHIIIGLKGFFRRANLIPNVWKLRIGATHELYTKKVDNNVQIQGLSGRMTGYWRSDIERGHKTGPHRTSIKSIEEYEKTYNDPFGLNSYKSSGFKKTNGKVVAHSTMLSTKNIQNLDPIDLPVIINKTFIRDGKTFIRDYQISDTQDENEKFAKKCGAKYKSNYDIDNNGFKMCSTTFKGVHSLDEIKKLAETSNEGSNLDKKISDLEIDQYAYRRYVCYKVLSDISTECYVTIWVKRVK